MDGFVTEQLSTASWEAADRLRELAYMAEEFDITEITITYRVQT